MKYYKKRWEVIDSETDRLKVPKGWIVRSIIKADGVTIHQIFIKDPKHKWKIEPKVEE